MGACLHWSECAIRIPQMYPQIIGGARVVFSHGFPGLVSYFRVISWLLWGVHVHHCSVDVSWKYSSVPCVCDQLLPNLMKAGIKMNTNFVVPRFLAFDVAQVAAWARFTAFTPKSDQHRISPAASPEILHDSMENLTFHSLLWWKMIILYNSHYLAENIVSVKGWENILFKLESERVNVYRNIYFILVHNPFFILHSHSNQPVRM